ncbi:MAG: NAD(P)-dependent oxidoreductase [Proteobacteria bacterium]|nr:NAD(P)-dependent oxidoreductase [Pseudomonadota bacterium]
MRVLVTGATGFIGQHLCAHLAERGDELIALVRSPKKASLLPAGTQVLEGDLTLFATDVQLPEVDVVIHLAGVVTATSPELYKAINEDAVTDLVACLERQSWTPRRLLFASSLAAAGPSRVGHPHTKADVLAPIDPYGEAKGRAEDTVRAASFWTTTFRPPLVFGPKDTATVTLYQAARNRVGTRVWGEDQRLSWVDVRDAVRGIAAMADDRREGHHTYYLSHPTPTRMSQLWPTLGAAVGTSVLVVPLPKWVLWIAMKLGTFFASLLGLLNQLDDKQYRQMVAPGFECDSRALRTDLGWEPRNDLASALSHAADGYRAEGTLRA